MSEEREGEGGRATGRDRFVGRQTARQEASAKTKHRLDLLKIVRC